MIRFTKMHGIGNDYIYINAFEERVENPAELAPLMADRHTGVGGDGIILIEPPAAGVEADVRMRMYNADGSESEMCGNGVRCVCKFAHDRGISTSNPMRVQTGRGVLSLDYTLDNAGQVESVTVDMGEPILELPKIPVREEEITKGEGAVHTVECEGVKFPTIFVSMGNPHAVIFMRDIARLDLATLGPMLERHPAFPNRMNVHFAHVHSSQEVSMRTWERGSGITLACGTGASAVCVAGTLSGATGRAITAHLPGGDLDLAWNEATNHVAMTGPAVTVFTGEWP